MTLKVRISQKSPEWDAKKKKKFALVTQKEEFEIIICGHHVVQLFTMFSRSNDVSQFGNFLNFFIENKKNNRLLFLPEVNSIK